jgi:hypothetical protein
MKTAHKTAVYAKGRRNGIIYPLNLPCLFSILLAKKPTMLPPITSGRSDVRIKLLLITKKSGINESPSGITPKYNNNSKNFFPILILPF